MKKITLLYIAFLLILSACGNSYQKVLKSNDFDLKLTKAKEYYNKGDYFRAIPLFEELMTFYKGSRDVEELYYFYAYSQYGQKDYLLAAFHFNEFIKSYPKSKHTEDSQFMIARCHDKLSPKPTLEQTNSQKAIEYYQLFANTHPDSERVSEANDRIDDLREKLEEKAFLGGELYFNMRSYKAATKTFENLLIHFPETERREKVLFLIIKSHYLLAANSINSKQQERFEKTVESYHEFVDNYSESRFLKEAEKYYQLSLDKLSNYAEKKL